jgi:uncharacterized caspase-like protein
MRPTLKHLCLAALTLALFAAPQAAWAQEKTATLHQVVAGVSKYAPTSGQRDLALPHKDAADVAGFFKDRGPQLFAQVRGEAMLNDQATRQNILDRLDAVVEEARPGDWAVIFLAGHGGPYGTDWCFCAHDSIISGQELKARIARLAEKKVTVILILDCCFAGRMAVGNTQAVVMAACRADEVSGESAAIGNGQFTGALLAGLRGLADGNRDGRVTLAELRSYVTQQVARFSDSLQTPLFAIPEGVDENLPVAVGHGN